MVTSSLSREEVRKRLIRLRNLERLHTEQKLRNEQLVIENRQLNNRITALEVEKFFAEEPTFTKTVNRKILGHMNDFRRCGQPYPADTYPVDWHDIAERINNMPINAGSRDSSYPIEHFNALLGINLPKRKYNYLSL